MRAKELKKVKYLSTKKNPLPIFTIAYPYIGEGTKIDMECHIYHQSATPEEKSHFAWAIEIDIDCLTVSY